jgi:hypothetical protein
VCATLLVTSQGPEELPARILRCVAVVVLLFGLYSVGIVSCVPGLFGMISACSFYSLKEVQGYMMLAYGGGMASVLWVLLLHVQAWAPLSGEWFLSFGVVAMRLVILGPIAGVTCLSLHFDLA